MGVPLTLARMFVTAATALAAPKFAEAHEFTSGPEAFVGAWRLDRTAKARQDAS